jgi:8-oxo-dGTP pyrophosphatase MutT (NUDIX family)
MKERVRAVLLDATEAGDEVVLFRRTRPGVPVYWAFPGGGVEEQDADLEAALRRELDEELSARVAEPVPLTALETVTTQGKIELQHLYACRLLSMDFDKRYGSEFSNPAKGEYAVERLPFTIAGLGDRPIMPEPLAGYVRANIAAIRAAA